MLLVSAYTTYSRSQQTAAKPDSMALLLVRNDIDFHRLGLHVRATGRLTCLDTLIDSALDITLKSLVESLEHGRASRQYNVFI